MKIKVTMKILSNYKKVYRCGYCDLQNIFRDVEPTFYNSGIYGWNCDIYEYGFTVAITTGYRNLKGERIPDEIIRKYDKIAKQILEKRIPYKQIKKRLIENRRNFINELNAL